ncbi:hypothetical protein DFA_03935 [Cavenderia fasciculata]|uniref:Uncharacterized protein n=1 Tax=Cavenderia fasciculata TaxID=261658 RepID=F4Q0U0_CACFS|nr:uncharacterized protein DFA_03935 [Cavenderia fasciculata]EGG18441.1 hypothetical protein DFA_03935 [Cavenderia fasciculata]|eukprot:XP_004366345.1 hypothetical protein DFA_03935 [Cavenderia fasciculata]
MDIDTFRNVFKNRFIISTIMIQMVKIRDVSASMQRIFRNSEFNDIGALLSNKQTTNLLKYKFARGDTSKLTFEPSRRFYTSLFRTPDVSLQHQIIDFLGDAIYDTYAFFCIESFDAIKVHHSVFIRFLDYHRDKNIIKSSMRYEYSVNSPIYSVEVYQSLMGPNKSLSQYFPITDSFFMVATKHLIKLVIQSYQAKRLFEKWGVILDTFTNHKDIGKLDYLSRVVESATIVYNNYHQDSQIDIAQKRMHYGNLLGSTSLEKIDVLVLLDLRFEINQSTNPLSIHNFMAMVYRLNDIKLLRLVLDHSIFAFNHEPLIEYSSHLTGVETFKQMTTIPRLKDKGKFFEYAANTLEKVWYMHTEMAYQFDGLSLSTVCKWGDRDVFFYVLDNIADKSPGFLNLYVDGIYHLRGDYRGQTSQDRIGHIDIIEHLVEQKYMSLSQLSPKVIYPLVQSKLLRTLCINPLVENIQVDSQHLGLLLLKMVEFACKYGMIDTLQDIIETYWSAFKTFNTGVASRCLISLMDNTQSPNAHQLIIKMMSIVDINSSHLLKIDITNSLQGGCQHQVIDYYMRLHYQFKDAGHRRRFFINVLQVKSLRRMIGMLVEKNDFIFIQHLIKYDSRANITSILEKSPTTFSKRFIEYSKAIKLVH